MARMLAPSSYMAMSSGIWSSEILLYGRSSTWCRSKCALTVFL